MDDKLNKDLVPEESAEECTESAEQAAEECAESAEPVEEAAEETKLQAENGVAEKITKRFSKYPSPSSIEEFAQTKKQEQALAEYKEAYDAFSLCADAKEMRKALFAVNAKYYGLEMTLPILKNEVKGDTESEAQTILNEYEKSCKKGKVASVIFLLAFLLLGGVFSALKIFPNIINILSSGSAENMGVAVLHIACLVVYVVLTVYAALEVKNLFASMALTKAQAALGKLENAPQKLESGEYAEAAELCINCGEKYCRPGSDYCEECEEKLLSTKVPLIGWFAGAGALIAGAFATVLVFFIMAPSILGMSAEIAANEKRWDDAFGYYNEMKQTTEQFASYYDTLKDFIKVGRKAQVNAVKAYAGTYGPLDAIQHGDYYLSDTSVIKDKELAGYMDIYNRYYDTSNIYQAQVQKLTEEAGYEEYKAALESCLGKEGVDDSFIYMSLYYLAGSEGRSAQEKFGYLQKCDEAAKANGYDYSWLYAYDYANACRANGDFAKAAECYKALVENNKSDMYSYINLAKSYISLGQVDEAKALLEELKEEHGADDLTYSIEAIILRCTGDYAALETLCDTAFAEYDNAPEVHHQYAIACLLQGKYDDAYYHANMADYNGYYWASQGVTKAYAEEYTSVLYLSAVLCSKAGGEEAETAAQTVSDLKTYEYKAPAKAEAIVNGETTLEEVFTKGAYDIL